MRFEIAEQPESFIGDATSSTEVMEINEAPTTEILTGLDGWLFSKYATDLLHQSSEATTGTIKAWQHELASRETYFSQRGIRYIHTCVPDKLTIHGDSLTTLHSSYSETARVSPLKLLSAHKSTLACLLDPSAYLLRQKGSYPLFWKSDTRWSPWSAYMTCQLLCSTLKVEINKQLLGYPFDECSQQMNLDNDSWPVDPEQIRTYRYWLRSKRRFANELVLLRESALSPNDTLLSQAEFSEGAHAVFENHHETAVNRSVVIFGDEQSADNRTLLTGMLAETFSEVHFVWAAGIDYDYIELVRPDVVITQGSELQLLDRPVTNVNMKALASRSMQNIQLVLTTDTYRHNATRKAEQGNHEKVEGSFRTTLILPTECYALDAPGMVQAHEDVANAETVMVSNEVVLHEVENAQVFFNGPSHWVHDSRDREVLRDNIPHSQKRANRWRRGKVLKGTTMLLATSPGAHCYYHWMLEILPKLGMLEREGVSLSSIDRFLVRQITGDWQLETLARFGIDETRIVETLKQPNWRCEKLLHIDLNCGINLKMHRFIPQWMKHVFPAAVTNEPRIKLYITRPSGVRRGIANEYEILPLLKAAGFTIMAMEGLTVAEQASVLARTEVLMSPHGGALTNMVFCRPGITVVELFSRHVFPYYYGLAANCHHHYHAILEDPEQDYPRLVNSAVAQSFAETQHETAGLSFDVSVDAIKAVLTLV